VLRRLVGLMAGTLLIAACSGTAGTAGPSSAPQASALPAGTYTSQAFRPALTFTLPAGWDVPSDTATYLLLGPAGSEIAGIHIFRDLRAAATDAACTTSPAPGVGSSSAELSTWIRGHAGLAVSEPRLVTVGGLRGTELDIAIASGWTASCPFANGMPSVSLFVGPTPDFRWVVAGNERLRLDLLDLPSGGTVVVDIDDFDGSVMSDLITAATPIVKSFVFATP
jgi:hypothetical protein